jgi:hypothetical protein
MSTKPNLATEPKHAEGPSLTIKRRLNAPPPTVYRAWTDPAQITRWFGPSPMSSSSTSLPATATATAGPGRSTSLSGFSLGRERIANRERKRQASSRKSICY